MSREPMAFRRRTCFHASVFERFSESARQVVVLAQDEARRSGHDHLGTEHLLLGVLRVEDVAVANALAGTGVDLESVRAHVPHVEGEPQASDQIPFTPEAKKALELALREALRLGSNSIGPEHLLLGLTRDASSTAVRILLALGVDGEQLRDRVVAAAAPRISLSQRHPLRRARRWDYRVVELGALETAGELEPLGRDGWELVTVVGEPGAYRGVLKRRA